jgi:histidine triad (HIT) family protein
MASVFTRIIRRELPARIFYETDEVVVIADHRPKDSIHLLIIPKAEYIDFQHTPPEVLSLMINTAKLIADKLGISDHYRLVINNGYGQEVPHVHFHFLSNHGASRVNFLED